MSVRALAKAFACTACLLLLISASPVASFAKENSVWQDELIYFIMVDRFYNGDPSNDFDVNVDDPLAYHGGDFKGIMEKLDYIKELGFTAIWLTPIFDNEAKGYHGYWTQNYYNTEEHFGTIDEFKQLVQEAHTRDIKVILDFVANHVGKDHPWRKDPAKQDWFHEEKDIVRWNHQQEVEDGWIYGLPDLAQENPETKKYLIDAAKWWIEETDIDGYRLDTVKHVPLEFWRDFSEEVKAVKTDFYLLGEVWSENPHYIARYAEAGIDGFADFPLNKPLRDTFAKADRSLAPLYKKWETNEVTYEHPELLGAFIDNHDMKRFGHDLDSDVRWELAFAYLLTQPEIPIVYYGSEIALEGNEDPDNRRMMDFEANPELREYVSELARIRQSEKALMRGTFELLYEKSGMAVFKREFEDEMIIIAINNSAAEQEAHFPAEVLERKQEAVPLFGSGSFKLKEDQMEIVLDGESSAIYKLNDKKVSFIPYIAAGSAVAAAFILFMFLAWKRGKKRIQ